MKLTDQYIKHCEVCGLHGPHLREVAVADGNTRIITKVLCARCKGGNGK